MLIGHMKVENSIYQSANVDANKQKEELDWVYRYTLLSPYAELMYAVSMVPDQNNIDHQFALNQSAMNFRPFSKIAYQQVLFLKLKGDDLNARKLLKRTLMVYPANLKGIVKSMSPQYRKEFLQVLTEVNPALSSQFVAN